MDLCIIFSHLYCWRNLANVFLTFQLKIVYYILNYSFLCHRLAGFVVVLAEAPCCCMFLDFVQTFTNFIERRPVWHKAALYIAISLPAMFFCASLSTFLGSAMLFATGVIYGLMALGKKASRGEMLTTAQTDFLATTLVKNMEVPIPNQSVP